MKLLEIRDHNEACAAACAVREMRNRKADERATDERTAKSRALWLAGLDAIAERLEGIIAEFEAEASARRECGAV